MSILAVVTALEAILPAVTALSAILASTTALVARLAASIEPLNSLYSVEKFELTSLLEIVVFAEKVFGTFTTPICLSPCLY